MCRDSCSESWFDTSYSRMFETISLLLIRSSQSRVCEITDVPASRAQSVHGREVNVERDSRAAAGADDGGWDRMIRKGSNQPARGQGRRL